jgi:hypothetical protein
MLTARQPVGVVACGKRPRLAATGSTCSSKGLPIETARTTTLNSSVSARSWAGERTKEVRSVKRFERRPDRCSGRASPDRLHFVYTLVMAAEDTTTVRVRRSDSERLQSLAKLRKTTVIDVLHEAIDALERQEFLRGLSDDYRRLREDPAKWKAFSQERQEWDSIG